MTPGTFLQIVFWVGVVWTLYAYLLFPASAAILFRTRRVGARPTDGRRPREVVSIIIPAFNEERSIGARIQNVLGSNYPSALLDVIVVSDASTDDTNAIVERFGPEGVRLIVQELRRGKTAGLNRAMKIARGSIVVFTDANAAYPPTTIGTLVRHFEDSRVGMVTGYTRYTLTDTGEVAEATNLYTSLERAIKKAESTVGCCVGADGAIFAIRRQLYRPLRDDDINDFVIPLNVIEQGYACVLAEDAFCSENPGKSLESEFRRQSRITNRTLRAIFRNARLLNPLRFPHFAFFLFSHKIARFLVPLFLMLSGAALLVLTPRGGIYAAAAPVAFVAVMLAVLSARRARGAGRPLSRLFRFVNVFLTINLAVLHGWWGFLTGRGDVTWQHDRA